MTRFRINSWLTSLTLMASVGLTACSEAADESGVVTDVDGNKGVKPEFVISIPRSVVNTRMDNGVTQNQGTVAQFRGMDNIRLLSFAETPAADVQKLSGIISLSPIQVLSSAGKLNYKVYADQFVPVGARHFLFYAKAVDNRPDEAITSVDDKFYYGVLRASGLTDPEFSTPSDISFSLEQISADAQFDTSAGDAIVTLLTALANASVSEAYAPNDKWSTATHPVLASLYRQFLSITTNASETIASLLTQLYASVGRVEEGDQAYLLAQAIRSLIDEASDPTSRTYRLKSQYEGYPQSAGLPLGAARIRWDGKSRRFVTATANYNASFRTDIAQYAYPAALWYYVSTPLKASPRIESPNYESESSWNSVISEVYGSAADVVQTTTQSVALQLPAEYGVGRLETRIEMGSGTFYDASGLPVNIGGGYRLTGMLIGGQNSVGYDFTSKGNENLTIYDREIPEGIVARENGTSSPNQTLALETKSNQVINVALELVNGGGSFMGADGIVPAGATFYLPAQLNPALAVNYQEGVLDKIFMQDHVTKLTITIENGSTFVDRNGDGTPDVYLKDEDGVPYGVDADGDGQPDPYDIDGDGQPDTFITDPAHGGPGWDTDGDGEVDRPVVPDENGNYPDAPNVNEGLGNATLGVPDLTSPFIELGTSVNLEWQEGLILNPNI